jgi:3-oxoacyl-[acyl-carrier protein] reductase
MASLNYVVVGGSKGIGLSLVHKLVKNGHKVTVLSRSSGLLPSDPMITHIPYDTTSKESETLLLPDEIDGVAYCPGSIVLKPFKSISDDQFLDDFNINVLGAVKIIKATLAGLKKSQNHPGIVLFSTIAVTQGMPFHASIAASKGAIEGLTRSLAAEFAPSIRVNAIAPSLTQTDLASKLLSSPEKIENAAQRHPLKAIGMPEDLADMACFLLSDQAKWITGQIMHVDGGMSTLKV